MTLDTVEIKSGNILIVDDDPTNIRFIERSLKFGGFVNIFSTTNPVETLSLCEQYAVDMVLLDLNMPVMDGFGVMKQLSSATLENKPVILVLTGQDVQEFRQKALDSGARDYIIKPCDVYELLSRVRNLLEMKLLQDFMHNENKILEERIRSRTLDLVKTKRDLHDTRLQVIRRLGRAAEFRDNETGFHIVRMSRIAELLGRAAGLNEYDCDLLLNASPMHDLGKIGIPDQILQKNNKLNCDEWGIMKTHAQIGADLLAGDESDLFQMAREIALTHHEKWDGSGYPNGLKGEEIPLVGRISAMADVFDALISKRPYKDAWPLHKAIAYIKSESGKHFDPNLVDMFMQHLEDILTITEQYDDSSKLDRLDQDFACSA